MTAARAACSTGKKGFQAKMVILLARVRGKESEKFGRDRLVCQASIPTTCRTSDGS